MGRQKIFEVRELDNDVSFLRNYLTKDLVKELDLYIYRKEGDEWVIVEKDWEKVRDGIVASMTNFGSPYLVIDNATIMAIVSCILSISSRGRNFDLRMLRRHFSICTTCGGARAFRNIYEDKHSPYIRWREEHESTLEK
jgi:spore cortex formation protein SpoVR/YcgB (stage V sporulation)